MCFSLLVIESSPGPRRSPIINWYLVLVQPRKTGNHPDMTEKLLTGT